MHNQRAFRPFHGTVENPAPSPVVDNRLWRRDSFLKQFVTEIVYLQKSSGFTSFFRPHRQVWALVDTPRGHG